ncbi:MAG: hypothetical protein ABIQ70_10560 [Dokdonella sp.]
MRTHLLRTAYASRALEAIEPDIGRAANDDDGVATMAPAAGTQPELRIALVSAQPKPKKDANDDDYLGGYAGI